MTKRISMTKKASAIILSLFMVLAILPLTAFADDNPWTNYAEEITETAGGVYEISTAEGLAYLAGAVNGGAITQYEYDENWDMVRKVFRLTADIDLSAHQWIPIGTDRNHAFQGVFDGNGHKITGMRIGSAEAPYNTGYYVGLFGYVSGEISDVTIKDSYVYAAEQSEDKFETYAGLLAGNFSGYSTGISSCDISGTVYTGGTSWSNSEYGAAGGIVGSLGNGYIESCRAAVTLGALDGASYFSLGGIAAVAGTYNSVTVKNCIASVTADMPEGEYYDSIPMGGIFAYGKNAVNCMGLIDCDGAKRYVDLSYASTNKNTYTIETNLKAYSNTTYQYEPQDIRCIYYGSDGYGTEKTEGEIKSAAFLDTLNTAAAEIDGAKTWSISEDENGGFPNIKKAGVRQYYKVSFISDGGTYSETTVPDGAEITKPEDPQRDGYTFLYWYSDVENEPYNFLDAAAGDITLYAKWDAHSYTVLFDTAGGSYVYPQSVNRDEKVALPETPEKKGLAFGGWFTDSSFETPWNFDNTVSEGMTLYAKWIAEEGSAVVGRITNTNGNGISGARVILSNGQNAMCDEFGFYRIANVQDGTYAISASAQGYSEASEDAFEVSGNASFDAVLSADGSGNLVSIYANITCVYSGIALRGVQVTAVGAGDLGTYTQYTDSKGFALFSGIPAGDYVFHINETGRAGWESYVSETETLTGDYSLTCALKPNYEELTVTVTGYDPISDAQDAPMANKKVKLTGYDPTDKTNAIINLEAETDENGAVTVEKVVPVTWCISCSDPCYTAAEEWVYTDASGKLTKNNIALSMGFVDSPLTVELKSIYSDPDIFKKTGGNGTESSKFSDDGRRELSVELVGVSGTLTEGISRAASCDGEGKANFTGLFPGTYRLMADGSAKRYVEVLSGDGKEIYSSTENTRYGPKYFYADFHGTGTANAALGKLTKASVKVTSTPVTFSGTLYKSDMDENGKITTVPVPNTKITIKPSAYYMQNGEAAEGHEITTDENGFYSIALPPGLYGVAVEDKFKDYFGGQLIYHQGATDTCYYDYNVRGWPCFERWTGTRASAWAWLSSGTQQPYGDIAGMNLSSGDVVADLVMMEKQFTYLLGDKNETVSGVGIGMETAAEMHMITGFERNPIFDDENKWGDCYYHSFKTVNYHTESRGATVTMTGTENKTLNMTGKKFPAKFNELNPGEYTFTYKLSDEFSHLSLSDWSSQRRERFKYDGVKSFTFYDFPAPGKLPTADNPFPEDYVDINYPDDMCKNPWPLSTVADTEVTVDFDETEQGHRTIYDLYDNDESDGELHFKFYHLDGYDYEYIDLSDEFGQARLQYMQSNPDLFPDLHVCNTDYARLASVDDEAAQGEDENAQLMAAVQPQTSVRYEYISTPAHMEEELVRDDDKGYIMSMLFAYETDKIPGKLFYTKQPRPGYYRRDQWDDQSYTSLPDGNITLYFCAHNHSNWDYYVLTNQGYHRNVERYPDLCNNDIWFSVELSETGATNCFLDFLNPGNCSAGTHILSQSEINNLLNPRTIKVKAIESGTYKELDVPVSVTAGGQVFTSGQTYPEQTCSSSPSAVTVSSDEWECPNTGMITGEYDESTKTETIIVPLTRKPYVFKLSIKDDAGNPVSNADITLAPKSNGDPVTIKSKADGSAQAGTVTHYAWSSTDEINGGLTCQEYIVTVLAQGYDGKRTAVSAAEVVSDNVKEITLNRISQPDIDAEKTALDKKGAFIPGVNYSGSSNAIEFVTSVGDDRDMFYLSAEGEIELLTTDSVKEFYLVDRKAFTKKDYSDTPASLEIPSADAAEYNPSAVYEWLGRLEKGELGNVYYQKFTGSDAVSYMGRGAEGKSRYSFMLTVPLWELPPDGFEPSIIAVTSRGAVQIHSFTYAEGDKTQLVGIRLTGDMATALNNIALMANVMAFGGEPLKKLDELTLPTGKMTFMPEFKADIKKDDDGYLKYNYEIKVSLMQGADTVSDAKSAYMSLAPRKLGLQMTATLALGLDGKECKLNEGFDFEIKNSDLQLKDYVPALFDSLPIKIDFDENKPLSGKSYLDFTQYKDKNNANIKTEDTAGMNGKLYLTAEASAFKALSLVPTLGPVLMSLEKSGALDIGAKMTLATGADGSVTFTQTGDNIPTESADFTVGAGAGLGFYAKALGGALGAEASASLSGDNSKLPDMLTVTATVDKDGYHMKEVQGKLTADAKIYIKTWFVNGQKEVNFGSIPFKYQFGTETQFVLQEININDNIRSRNDFEPSAFNGRPETVVENLLPIGGYAGDEDAPGTFVYTSMDRKGGKVCLNLSEYSQNDTWLSPVKITDTNGVIPAYDVISIGDGEYLAVWTEIAPGDMEKTCPPSEIKYSVGSVNNGTWTGSAQTLDALSSEVASKLLLVSDRSGVSLIALKTAEGPLAEKLSISGYKFDGSGFGGAAEIAAGTELYDISACAASGKVIVSFVTADNTLHALTWDGSVSENTFGAYGFETALASDDDSAYLVSETKTGLALYSYSGGWTQKQYAVTSMVNNGNPALAVKDGNIIITWTGKNDTKLYSAVLNKSGRVISGDNETASAPDGRFADSTAFVSDAGIRVMTVLCAEDQSLNVYGIEDVPQDDNDTYVTVNSVNVDEDSGSVEVSVSLETESESGGEEPQAKHVFATVIDGNGKVKDIDVEEVTDTATLNLDEAEDAKYIKVFWWESLQSMKPLAKPTLIRIDDVK